MNSCVGIVDSVSAYEVKAFLLDSAPRNVALSGGISLFPRINGFLVIPNETGSLVGMITWIGYNHQKNENEVGLPKGMRMISLAILGHIVNTIRGKVFERGAFSLPTVGDQIVLPSEEELELIVKNDVTGSISIGTAPLNGNKEVKLPINELFGRHVAVLGNTGSGKSCTVAGLIRWSIEQSYKSNGKSPNARFVILDPNGEYDHAFDDLKVDVLKFKVEPVKSAEEKQLRIPAWMWTSNEWASIFKASDKTQKPILREALRTLRSASDIEVTGKTAIVAVQRRVVYLKNFLQVAISSQQYISKDTRTKFGTEFLKRVESLEYANSKIVGEDIHTGVEKICNSAKELLAKYHGTYNGHDYYKDFDSQVVEEYLETVKGLVTDWGSEDTIIDISEDDPIEFSLQELPGYITTIAEQTSAAQFVDFMTIRIKSMLRNAQLSPVIANSPKVNLLDWVIDYLGTEQNGSVRGKICVIDLSLLSSEMVHLMVSTIARLTFESLQRYRRYYDMELPTLLVMEEAHNFIHRYNDEDAEADKLCSQIFERIAREGRKFGLGLMVSSQRPAELSQTVLSQCNSFIIHRIVNDRDQEMVKRMVPDNMGNILSELPVLPTRKAIVLGSAISIPTIVDINELSATHRPKSNTPDFWNVWTGEKQCQGDWNPIVNEWQRRSNDVNDGAQIEKLSENKN